MPDEIKPEGQAPTDGANGQAPTAPETVVETEYIKALRAENAKWRTEAQAAKAKVLDFEKAQMTETEKLQAQAQAAQAEAQAAQTELRKARAQAALATAASKQGLDASLLGRLVEVDFDDNGQPVNVDARVQAVLTQYPQLRPASVGVTNPGNAGRTPKLTMADVKKMSPAEINERWDEVQAAMITAR